MSKRRTLLVSRFVDKDGDPLRVGDMVQCHVVYRDMFGKQREDRSVCEIRRLYRYHQEDVAEVLYDRRRFRVPCCFVLLVKSKA